MGKAPYPSRKTKLYSIHCFIQANCVATIQKHGHGWPQGWARGTPPRQRSTCPLAKPNYSQYAVTRMRDNHPK